MAEAVVIVLGLDQAPRGTGWAVGDGSRPPSFGYKEFPDFGYNERLLKSYIIAWLLPFCREHKVEAIFTEQIIIDMRHPNPPVFQLQAAVLDAISTCCMDEIDGHPLLGIEHYDAKIGEWRKFAGIVGPDWKDAAIRWSAMRRNIITPNHHVAEAIAIWHFGLSRCDPAYRAQAQLELRRAQHQQSLEFAR